MSADAVDAGRHCDDYIQDPDQPYCLRWFLFINRLPAADIYLCQKMGVEPRLYASTSDGRRWQVTMASRMGDVGITTDLWGEGYTERVMLSELHNFGDRP